MKTYLTLFFTVFTYLNITYSQPLHVNWTRFIGPDSCCAVLSYAIPTRDGGIVFTGNASAVGSGDIPASTYGGVIAGKMDSNHNLIWVHSYGGSHGVSMCETPDGGFGILAYTGDIGIANGNITGYKGNGDMWLIRIDSAGNFLWGNCYGSDSANEQAISIAATKDNGFILLGGSNGSGQDVPYHLGNSEFEFDWFVVKTDSSGNKEWVKDLGGSDDEDLYGCIVSADTGYYLFGASLSKDHDCIDTAWHAGVNTNYDYYILRLSDTGSVIWAKSFGGSGGERAGNGGSAIWDSRDNTIVVTGSSSSNDYMVTGNAAGESMWTIKVDKSGTLVWQKIMTGIYGGAGTSVSISEDSGYVLLSGTSGAIGLTDNWIFTVDKACNVISNIMFGGTNRDGTASVFPFKQGYIATGSSTSSSGFTEGNNYGTLGWGEKCTISYIGPTRSYVPDIVSDNRTLLLFPNPANGQINIFLPDNGNGNLTVINTFGQRVFSKNVRQQKNIDIDMGKANWVSGLYLVEWQGEDGMVQTGKFIKM